MYQNLIKIFQTDWVKSSTQSNLVIQKSCSTDYHVLFHPSFESVMSQLSSLTIIYFILGVKSWSPTLLVAMSANYRPPSHQSIVCILHFYPFLTKFILLEIFLVCLVSLPFLSIYITDLLAKTIRGSYSETMSGYLFKNSWINILKCAKSIPEVYAVLYSLSALDWETSPGKCVPWSIGPTWYRGSIDKILEK